MLVSNFDIIQLEIQGDLENQDIRNVFHYRILTDAPAFITLDDVFLQWAARFDSDVMFAFTNALAYRFISAKNLTVPIQIFETGISAFGGQAGEYLPVHDALSIKLVRSTGLTRNGRKSYSGITESYSANGMFILNDPDTLLFEEFHGTILDFVTDDDPAIAVSFEPVIVGRTKDAQGVYQLDLNKTNRIANAKMNKKISTQNTRK